MLLKFGQKVFAQRRVDSEWEQGIVLKCDLPTIFVGFPDGTVWQVPYGRVKTKAKAWREKHSEKLAVYQRQRRARLQAEKHGITLEEAVYRQEQRRAKQAAKKDPKAKQREYWRKRQQAHREKKAETDG